MMLVSEIVSRVRSAIDELMKNDSDFLTESADEDNLTQIIIDKIGYALQYVIANAPLEKLDGSALEIYDATALASNFAIDPTTAVGRLVLPADLLRIVEARLSSWSHFPEPLPDTSQVALMQQDEHARGSWDRPVNILTYDGSDRCLLMYCARTATGTGADTLKFTFVRKPQKKQTSGQDPQDYYDVPAALEASLIYQVAGMAMTAFREESAASLFAIAQRYLEADAAN